MFYVSKLKWIIADILQFYKSQRLENEKFISCWPNKMKKKKRKSKAKTHENGRNLRYVDRCI